MKPSRKRARYYDHEAEDPFASSSAAHISASSSSSDPSARSVLRPCSFEITLCQDSSLKHSLQLPPRTSPSDDDGPSYGTRLVTWASSSEDRSITTDRYDAVHLLSSLPPRAYETPTELHADNRGWSDLDSDTEDVFYMSTAEASDFSHAKARARLDAQRAARLALLSPSPPPAEKPAERQKEEDVALSRSLFELMQKTARVLAGSTNASMLELKILANHSEDARFRFLRKDGNELSEVWRLLKEKKGELEYEVVAHLLQSVPEKGPPALGLGGYESDAGSDEERPKRDAEAATEPEDKDKDKKQKQAERLARAKEWLKTRPSRPSPGPR